VTVLIVSGSRAGHPHVAAVLDRWVGKRGAPDYAVIGDALGVDRQALEWCIDRDHFFVAFCAEWERLKGRAGPGRNLRMVKQPPTGSDLVAFPSGGPGTADCMRAGRAHEHRVFEVDLRGWVHALV
jgi:hypothetical protein